MSKTKIFLSSTCYDLTQVREDLKKCIINIGHDPILSDYPSFPVLPELGTVENCKRNVRKNADIFLLVVGGKRGSLDPITNKSITNLEYETAKYNKIDTFVFVKNSVMNLFQIWEKNPAADFTPQVDYPLVFQFIQSLKSDQKWIFTFEKASEIIEVLTNQLSVFFKYLIDKKKEGKLKPLKEFLEETEKAQQIALDRPEFWEFLLTDELLRTKLVKIKQKLDDLQNGLIYRKAKRIKGKKFFDTISLKCKDLVSIMGLLKTALKKEIVLSWGAPGESGDAIKIKRAVDLVITGCEELLEWEIDLCTIVPPSTCQDIKIQMRGWTTQILDQIFCFPDMIIDPLKNPDPGKKYNIKIVFEPPPNIDELNKKIEWLALHPEQWIDE